MLEALAPLRPLFELDLNTYLFYAVAPIVVLFALTYLLLFFTDKARGLVDVMEGVLTAAVFGVVLWALTSYAVQSSPVNGWFFPIVTAGSFGFLTFLAVLRGNADRGAGILPVLQLMAIALTLYGAVATYMTVVTSLAPYGGALLAIFWLAAMAGVLFTGILKDWFLPRSSTMNVAIGTLAILIAMLGALTVHWMYSHYTRGLEYAIPIAAIGLVVFVGITYFIGKQLPALWEASLVYRAIATFTLIGLAALAVMNYTNFGNYRYNSYLNAYEFYHYYIGTKYAPEVGYENMYNATVVADDETGLIYRRGSRDVKDLATGGRINYKEILKDRERFRNLFSEARWQEFLADIRWFKKELTPSRYSGMIGDKGYNGTPMWSMVVGGVFSNNVPTSSAWGMHFLALLDAILIGFTFLAVWWAFGLRTSLLLACLVGSSYVMHFSHMKGAYLRTDFAMSLVLAICMLKKEHYGWAGMFAAYSFCSRVFPAVFFFGLGAKLLWHTFPLIVPAAKAWFKKLTPVGAILADLAATALILGLTWVLVEKTGLAAKLPGALTNATWKPYVAFLIVGAVGITIAYTMIWGWVTGRLPRRYLAFFSGATATVLVLFFGSVIYYWGVQLHPERKLPPLKEDAALHEVLARKLTDNMQLHVEYAEKISGHNDDISPWRVGFKYLFIARWSKTAEGDPVGDVADVQQQSFLTTLGTSLVGRWPYHWFKEQVEDRPLGQSPVTAFLDAVKDNKPYTRSAIYNDHDSKAKYNLILLLVLVLGFFAVAGLKDNEALAWSFVPVFFLVAPTYYYYIMLVVPMLFFAPYLDRPSRLLGTVFLLLIAFPGYWIYSAGWRQGAGTYIYHSIMIMGVVLYMFLCAYADTLGIVVSRAWRHIKVMRHRAKRRHSAAQAHAGATASHA